MLDHPEFYPVLNRIDWRGADSAFTRKVYEGNAGSHGLLVSYGVVTETTNEYMTKEYMTKEYMTKEYMTKETLAADRIDPEQMHKVAIKNLAQREGRPKWRVEEIGGAKCLTRAGDELTAADLLYPPFLAKACEDFKGRQVYLAIPNRFVMILGTKALDLAEGAAGMFAEAVEEKGPALTPVVFEVREGKLVGDVPVPEDAGELGADDSTGKLSEAVLYGPWATFDLVAGIDGNVDKKEVIAFVQELQKAVETSSPMIQGILGPSLLSPEGIMERIEEINLSPPELLAGASIAIAEDLPDHARREYIEMCLELGHGVAAASGGFLGFGSKVSKDEKKALEFIRYVFENPPSAD